MPKLFLLFLQKQYTCNSKEDTKEEGGFATDGVYFRGMTQQRKKTQCYSVTTWVKDTGSVQSYFKGELLLTGRGGAVLPEWELFAKRRPCIKGCSQERCFSILNREKDMHAQTQEPGLGSFVESAPLPPHSRHSDEMKRRATCAERISKSFISFSTSFSSPLLYFSHFKVVTTFC